MTVVFETDHPQPLGAFVPAEKPYAAKYPLLAADISALAAKPVPVIVGCDWHENFDNPVLKNGRWWVGDGDLGEIRGGHAICFRPPNLSDLAVWWRFYDQGSEGACVGFSSSRMMTLLNRARYDAPWLYREARKVDPWPGEAYEGTSVDAAMQILRARGHKTPKWTDPRAAQGISAYRWLSTLDEMIAVLGAEKWRTVGGLPFLNSWGERGYPHQTWMPLDVVAYLLHEGEAVVVTDR